MTKISSHYVHKKNITTNRGGSSDIWRK